MLLHRAESLFICGSWLCLLNSFRSRKSFRSTHQIVPAMSTSMFCNSAEFNCSLLQLHIGVKARVLMEALRPISWDRNEVHASIAYMAHLPVSYGNYSTIPISWATIRTRQTGTAPGLIEGLRMSAIVAGWLPYRTDGLHRPLHTGFCLTERLDLVRIPVRAGTPSATIFDK
jgi:hypothetical protein